MVNKKNWLGMLVMVLAFGMVIVGCKLPVDEKDEDGSTSPDRTITIKNNTGYTIGDYYNDNFNIKPSTSSDWGSVISLGGGISNGESRAVTLPPLISNNGIYDIRVRSSYGFFSKYNITITNGSSINFNSSDYDDGSQNPKITIQNLSGTNFNSIYVKPSSASDWGVSLGSVYNNSTSSSIALPFRLAYFSIFDIQVRSSSPDNTYTKNNVSVSDGIVVIFKPNDTDNPSLINPVIIIQNNTGYTIGDYYNDNFNIKPSTSSDWGSVISLGGRISDGESRAITLAPSIISNNTYDFRIRSDYGFFIRSNVVISYGMTITFNTNDLAP
jgi:hypothetical protein